MHFVCESGEVVPFEAPLLHFILTFSLALFSLVILVCVTVVFGTHLHSDISTVCYTQYPSGTPPLGYLFSDFGTICPSETPPRRYLCSELGIICPFGTPSLWCLFWFRYYMSFRNTVPIGYLFLFGCYMSVRNTSPNGDLLLRNHVPDSYKTLTVLLIYTVKSGKTLGSDKI